MVGRLVLLWLNKKVRKSIRLRTHTYDSFQVGEQRVLYLYAVLAIGYFFLTHPSRPSLIPVYPSLELVVWFVPSLIGGAVSVSLIGVVLGPMYPIVMNHAGRIVPRWLLSGSIGWIAGFGQAGSALFPFITGAIASKTGIKALQPLYVGLILFSCRLTFLTVCRLISM
jgi:MFS family permease